MRKTIRAVSTVAFGTMLLVAGCMDATRPTAPITRSGSDAQLLGGLLGSVTSLLIAPINRATPLANDVTWTFTASPGGSVSSNSAVGLTINVPAGAVSSPVTITVTALKGAPVAYRFSPHIVFNKKVHLTQNMQGLSYGGLLGSLVVKGAHFPGDTLQLTSGGLAIVDEIVSAIVLPWSKTSTFSVGHFSGWIWATGYSSSSEEAQ